MKQIWCWIALMSLLGCSEVGDDVRAANPNRPSQPESAAASDPATPTELVDRAGNLWGEQRYADALTLVERAIELAGENEDLVEFRCDLLFKLERGPELLEATMRLEEISTRKTPWLFLKIADAHLFMGETNLTLDWIEKAVRERNFTKFSIFDADRYDPIRSDPRFVAILAEIRDGLGLGQPARSFAVELIDGSELTLADLAGEVVLIDFWATWCPPCLKELPNLERLYGDYHQRGFEIIGISLDEGNGVDRAHEFLAEKNLPWKLALSGRGYEDEIAKLYEVSGLPSTWLIDRNGTLRHVEIHGEELRQAVEALLL